MCKNIEFIGQAYPSLLAQSMKLVISRLNNLKKKVKPDGPLSREEKWGCLLDFFCSSIQIYVLLSA